MKQNTAKKQADTIAVSSTHNNTPQQKLPANSGRGPNVLFSKRLFILVPFSVAVILFELFHYRLDGIYPFDDFSFWAEIIVYGLVLPLSLLIVLNVTERRTFERDEAIQELDYQFELSRRLSASLSS